MSIFKDQWGEPTLLSVILIWAGIMLGIFALVAVPVTIVDRYSCGVYEEATQRPTQYEFFQCWVYYDGVFIPKEEYTARAVTNEVRKPQ